MRKRKILIADDHESIRRTLVRHLASEFEVVAAVADGAALVESAVLLSPDVIVSDVSMPRLTGPEAMEELHGRGYNIPFVFISVGENRIGNHVLFVSKNDLFDQLEPAIHRALSRLPLPQNTEDCPECSIRTGTDQGVALVITAALCSGIRRS